MDERTWRLSKNGQEFGPYPLTQLKQYAAEGRILPGDMLWASGMSEWVPASQIPELVGSLHVIPLGEPVANTPQPQAYAQSIYNAGNVPQARKSGGKKILVGILAAVIVVLIVILAVAMLSPGGPTVHSAEMASEVDNDYLPVTKTDVFQPDSPEFYATMIVRNAAEGDTITAVWMYEDDLVIDTVTYDLLADEDNAVLFSLSRPDAGWPEGDFSLEIYTGEERLLETLKFEVAAGTGSTTASTTAGDSLQIINAGVTAELDSDNMPVGTSDQFATDTPEIYVTLEMANMEEGLSLTAYWYYLDDDYMFSEYTVDLNATDDYMVFYLTMPDDGWPEGTYKVELVSGPDILETVDFTVR